MGRPDAQMTTSAAQTRPARWPLAVLALAMLACAVLVMVLTRRDNLSQDELYFLLYRGGTAPRTFLEPYNEHIMVVPLLVYKALWRIFGVADYWPFRLTVVVLHLTCVGLLYAVARRQLGAVYALVPALALLFLGTAWEVVLQLSLVVFLLPLAGGLVMLLALARDDRRGDWVACAALLLALLSGSLGVVFALGGTILIALGGDARGRLLRVVAGPLAVWILWRLAYGDGRLADHSADVPELVARYAASTVAGVAGFSYGSAPALWLLLTFALLAAAVAAVARRRQGWQLLLAVLVMSFVYWLLIALFRPPLDPLSSRYLYPAGAFVLLLAGGVVGRRALTPAGAGAAAALAVLLVASQIGDLRHGADRLRDHGEFVSAGLGALELARDQVRPGFRPEPVRAPDVVAARYFPAVAAYGSPADSEAELRGRPADARQAADIVSMRALRVALTREGAAGAGPCTRVPDPVDMELPAGGLVIRNRGDAPVTVKVRRFGDAFAVGAPGRAKFPLSLFRPLLEAPELAVPRGEDLRLVVPPDRAQAPWRVGMRGGGRTLACTAAPGQ